MPGGNRYGNIQRSAPLGYTSKWISKRGQSFDDPSQGECSNDFIAWDGRHDTVCTTHLRKLGFPRKLGVPLVSLSDFNTNKGMQCQACDGFLLVLPIQRCSRVETNPSFEGTPFWWLSRDTTRKTTHFRGVPLKNTQPHAQQSSNSSAALQELKASSRIELWLRDGAPHKQVVLQKGLFTCIGASNKLGTPGRWFPFGCED